MNHLEEVIEKAWDTRADWDMHNVDAETREAVKHAIELLDNGGITVTLY